MSEHDQAAGLDDARIVERLRTALAAEDTTDLDDDRLADLEAWAKQLFAAGDATFPAAVSAATDQLIPRVDVSDEMRTRLIEAAERALAERRTDHGLLPIVLRAARRRAQLDVADVTDAVGDQIALLESGETPVTLQTKSMTIARWIRAVDADRNIALAALERSLRAAGPGQLRPAAGDPSAPKAMEELIARVRSDLEELDRGDAK